MPQRLQNRATACLITLCIVALAILLGGRSSLLKLCERAGETFFRVNGDSYSSIDYDLSEIRADSNNLITIAGHYLDDNDIMIEAVRKNIEMLELADTPQTNHSAAESLRASVADLDALLLTMSLSDTDRTYHTKLIANIESRYRTIANNSYNAAAASFNRELQTMPASHIAAVTGVGPLQLYE